MIGPMQAWDKRARRTPPEFCQRRTATVSTLDPPCGTKTFRNRSPPSCARPLRFTLRDCARAGRGNSRAARRGGRRRRGRGLVIQGASSAALTHQSLARAGSRAGFRQVGFGIQFLYEARSACGTLIATLRWYAFCPRRSWAEPSDCWVVTEHLVKEAPFGSNPFFHAHLGRCCACYLSVTDSFLVLPGSTSTCHCS